MRIQYHRTGTVWLDGRTWWFRAGSKSKAIKLGSSADIKTKTAARKAAAPLVSAANDPQSGVNVVLNEVIKGYRLEEMKHVRLCTSRAYECWLENHIIPRWGRVPVAQIEALEFRQWLESLEISGKSRAEIRGVMNMLFRYAILRKFVKANPMKEIRLRGVKRKSRPQILTVDEFKSLAGQLAEPFRTMSYVAMYHGLRVSELLGLKWMDVDWLGKSLSIQRSMVCQVEEKTKTEYSQSSLPLEDGELAMLKAHRSRTEFTAAGDYIFASPHSGGQKPYHYTSVIWKIHSACGRAGIARVGTHVFRHTARAWAGQAGVNVSVMKDMLRHADIRTTMNTYGGTVKEELRTAHGKVVRMVKGV
jgi:integrase